MYCCISLHAGGGTNTPLVIPELVRILSEQRKGNRWSTFLDTEEELGLKESSITPWFGSIGLGVGGKQRKEQWKKPLNAAGIYRQKSKRCGREVWWIAFAGKRGPRPYFTDKSEHHVWQIEVFEQ